MWRRRVRPELVSLVKWIMRAVAPLCQGRVSSFRQAREASRSTDSSRPAASSRTRRTGRARTSPRTEAPDPPRVAGPPTAGAPGPARIPGAGPGAAPGRHRASGAAGVPGCGRAAETGAVRDLRTLADAEPGRPQTSMHPASRACRVPCAYRLMPCVTRARETHIFVMWFLHNLYARCIRVHVHVCVFRVL